MKCSILFGILFSCVTGFAANTTNCDVIKSEQFRLSMLASNLSNANTTRTPRGGPYQPFKIKSCSKGSCDFVRGGSPVIKYLPGHPDADVNGYVAYPNIDRTSDYAMFNMAAAKLRLLGKVNSCDTKIIDNGSSVMLSYSARTAVKEDIFNFDKNQRVVSWMRTDAANVDSALNFKPSGEVVSYK